MANAIFLPTTPDILSSDDLAGSDVVRAEICSVWPSEERFYEHGFGVVAVLEGEIICPRPRASVYGLLHSLTHQDEDRRHQ